MLKRNVYGLRNSFMTQNSNSASLASEVTHIFSFQIDYEILYKWWWTDLSLFLMREGEGEREGDRE